MLWILCGYQINLPAQCFPTDPENCPTPATVLCNVSPSTSSSCSAADLDRTISGSVSSGNYFAPDSKINASGQVAAANTVLFQAREINLMEGFVVTENSDFKALAEPVWEQFAPVLLSASNVNEYSGSSFNHEDLNHTYGFELPVRSPVVLCANYSTNYMANKNNLYFMSLFGPRYLDDNFDFHQGSDIVDRKITEHTPGVTYYWDIVSMCTGVVVERNASDGTIKVRCNDTFNKPDTTWPKDTFGSCIDHFIYIAYRHLATFEPCIQVGKRVEKGDKIGVMGKTGATFKHLHLSVQRKKGANTFKNVHPMRLFRPSQVHLLKTLDNTSLKIYRLKPYSPGDTQAFFRFVFSYDHIAIRYLQFSYGSTKLTYDFESVSAGACQTGTTLDNSNCVDGLKLYPYPFNRGTCAYGRYIDAVNTMPASFPASPLFGSGNYYPLLQSTPFDQPNYVLDVVVDLSKFPGLSNLSNLQIRAIDIYGRGVSANP